MLDRLIHKTSYASTIALISVLGGWAAALSGFFFISAASPLPLSTFSFQVLLIATLLSSFFHLYLAGIFLKLGIPSPVPGIRFLNARMETYLGPSTEKTRFGIILKRLNQLPLLLVKYFMIPASGVLASVFIAEYSQGFKGNVLYLALGGLAVVIVYLIFVYIIAERISAPARAELRRRCFINDVDEDISSLPPLRLKFLLAVIVFAFSLTIVIMSLQNEKEIFSLANFTALLSTLFLPSLLLTLLLRTIQDGLRLIQQSGTSLIHSSRETFFNDGLDREITAACLNINQAAQSIDNMKSALEDNLQELDAANRAKSEFLTMISHELRTPLNGIMGMTDLLKRTSLDQIQQNHLETIQSSSQSLLALIGDILDVSGIQSGKKKLEYHHFDLEQRLLDLERLYEPMAREKNLKFLLRVSPRVPSEFYGDPIRLKQILANLVINAIKFTDEGSVSLRFYCRPLPEGRYKLSFAVRDTGIGIKKEDHGRVFLPFHQVQSGISRQYGGTGLGLTICSHLVQLMGSQVRVRSIPGKGSVFYFSIVLEGTAEKQTQTAPAESTEKESKLAEEIPLRILITEDNEINRMVLKKILEKIGYDCDEARDGQESLEMSEKNEYDLIFMDLEMPRLDGLEAARLITARDAEKPVIIALTAHTQNDVKSDCLQAGMKDFLTKPVSIKKIYNVLKTWGKAKAAS